MKRKKDSRKTKTVMAKDLKAGDVTVDGVVGEVDTEGNNWFWGGRPNYSFYDVNESGPWHSELKMNTTFEVLTERRDIVDTYKKIEYEMMKKVFRAIEDQREFSALFNNKVESMSNDARRATGRKVANRSK